MEQQVWKSGEMIGSQRNDIVLIGALMAQAQKEAQHQNNVAGGFHVVNDRVKYRIDQKGTDYEHIHLKEDGKERI